MDGHIHTPERRLAEVGATVRHFPVRAEQGAGLGRAFGRLRLLSVADAAAMPPRRYLLHGIMGEGEFSMWWGPPKCGKSFLMLRIAYGLALGVGMWGREAAQVPVIYVAAEGQKGFGQRIQAIAERMGEATGFHWIGQAVDLFDPNADLESILEAVHWTGAKLLVVDTVARATPGADENRQLDMGIFVRHCDRIREETGAHVAVVHHGKAEGEWGRGSTALPGAVDLAVKITGGPGLDVPRKAEIAHAKDDASGDGLPFALRGAELPPVNDVPRFTCVAEEVDATEAHPRQSARRRPAGAAGRALDLLTAEIAARGEPLPSGEGFPTAPTYGVTEATWRAAVYRGVVGQDATDSARRKAFGRAADALAGGRYIGLRDGWVWPT